MAKYLGIPLQVASGTTVTATYGSPELVVNGNFLNGATDWQPENAATIAVGTHEGRSNVADINVTSSSLSRVKQPFDFVNGVKYQITVEVYLVSGAFRVDAVDEDAPNDFISTTTTGSWQTLTGTFTGARTNSGNIFLRGSAAAAQFYVDSISIKEVQYNYLQVVGGDLLKESKVGDVVFNSTDDNEAVVVQVINNDTLLLSNDILSDAGDAFSIFAPNGDTRGNQILRIDNYIISEYDEATSAPNQSSFWFAAGPQADKVTLTQLNNAVNTYFVADIIERFVQRLNAQSATASRLDIPLNEFRDHKYNQVLTTTAITLS